ncbi:MAG TPA: arginine--tRNA ligase [Saprospiraceae bacterium]|nr:arginine--tRNA ligase [Saprospiraceae bacterium]
MNYHIQTLKSETVNFFQKTFQLDITENEISINPTRKEFDGDFTVVLFPFLKKVQTSPAILGEQLGVHLINHVDFVDSFNTVQGFLNLMYNSGFFLNTSQQIANDPNFGKMPRKEEKVLVEFSSPNTNKPLHLGHIRNILLGWSLSMILEKAGFEVIKTQIINDRGIAVCKSMLAWKKFGQNVTPASSGRKGDHLVGDFYVLFDQKLVEEYVQWQESSQAHIVFQSYGKQGESREDFFKRYKNDYFNHASLLGSEAREMLRKWEEGDEETLALWRQLNEWVYEGFQDTYEKLGVHFDKIYYESQTYLLGKETVEYGLQKGIFDKEEDGSVWVDLVEEGYDRKIILRSDGTSVYITQDIGTAMVRYKDFGIDRMVYVVGDEQEYHFQVLFEILKKLGEPYATHLHHLSYGMVELPHGRMKSREGTVVDADDLIEDIVKEAHKAAIQRGDLPGASDEENHEIFRKIGMAALKYHMIKVTPKKRMIFNPEESLDLQGQTGPYIQNAFVRIRSILRKTKDETNPPFSEYIPAPEEKELIKMMMDYPNTIAQAAQSYDPSVIANFSYSLAKSFHKFYHDFRIIGAESVEAKSFRIQLIRNIANTIQQSMKLLGIEMPERM